jgi:hypothetical protein
LTGVAYLALMRAGNSVMQGMSARGAVPTAVTGSVSKPGVGAEVDHLAKNRENLSAQVPVPEFRCAEGRDALAGSGPRPGSGHLRSVTM